MLRGSREYNNSSGENKKKGRGEKVREEGSCEETPRFSGGSSRRFRRSSRESGRERT